MRQYLDLNLYIGITGWLCDPQRGQELREAVKYLPIESLLVETDAPYLLPKDLAIKPKDRINLPQFLPHIVQRIAEIKKIEIELLIAQIYKNTLNCFGLTDDA
jgi:TatD DNase family protein